MKDSWYLDTRHLYEMTRSPDPRDLVTCCVQLLTTFYGIPLGIGLRDAVHLVCETTTGSPGSGVWCRSLTPTQLRVAVCS